MTRTTDIAIVGSGPAALMAAHAVSNAGFKVTLFEKRKSAGRKLLVAGSSGLNITHEMPIEQMVDVYTGSTPSFWQNLLQQFSPKDWLSFFSELGLETFLGTSRRYFVKEMKASGLLQSWMGQLESRGVEFQFEHELIDFFVDEKSERPCIRFSNGNSYDCRAVCFALGGGSWEKTPVTWPKLFSDRQLAVEPFLASNVGYQVNWNPKFLEEAEGLPLKGVRVRTSRGSQKGDLMITAFGVEGTPIYTLGSSEEMTLDLKPDLSVDQILDKLESSQENLSPLRRINKRLKLGKAAQALLFHHSPAHLKGGNLKDWANCIKEFPIRLLGPQPLSEAISSSGGLKFQEVDHHLMIKRMPGFFVAGEMLDWDAPTGGFLIQASVSLGCRAGKGILEFLERRVSP